MWETIRQPGCTEKGSQQRSCASCGFVETASIEPVGHTAIIDSAVEPSCEKEGLSEGSHCSVCQAIILRQEKIAAIGHAVEQDKGFLASCEKEGLTDGTHCSICNVVLDEQKPIVQLSHDYRLSYVIKEATCLKEGEKKYTCLNCKDTCEKSYQLEKYNASQIYIYTELGISAADLGFTSFVIPE